MYEKIITPRSAPVVSVAQLCAFGRFDVPQQYVSGSSPQVETDDYALLELFIEAATDEVETTAAQACLNEQVLLTYDFFPNQQDPRNFLNYQLSYAYNITPWWWFGFPQMDSIELVRRPVLVQSISSITSPGGTQMPGGITSNAVTVQYNDQNGVLQTFDPSNYTVQMDKICLNVGSTWPLTDMRQDCIQITYWAGYDPSDATQVPARLRMAILFLANHFWNIREIISVEPTSQIGMTLNRMLGSFRSMRIPK
jgi:hypothetical protein